MKWARPVIWALIRRLFSVKGSLDMADMVAAFVTLAGLATGAFALGHASSHPTTGMALAFLFGAIATVGGFIASMVISVVQVLSWVRNRGSISTRARGRCWRCEALARWWEEMESHIESAAEDGVPVWRRLLMRVDLLRGGALVLLTRGPAWLIAAIGGRGA